MSEHGKITAEDLERSAQDLENKIQAAELAEDTVKQRQLEADLLSTMAALEAQKLEDLIASGQATDAQLQAQAQLARETQNQVMSLERQKLIEEEIAEAEQERLQSMEDIGKSILEQVGHMSGLNSVIGQNISASGVLLGVFSMIAGMVVELNDGVAGLAAQTGFGDGFRKDIMASAEASREFGATLGDNIKAIQGLADSFTSFANISASARAEFTATAAILQQIGVDASTSGAIFEDLTRVLGQSSTEATKTATQIVGFGLSIGMSANKITASFGPAMADLSVHGSKAIDVFKNLAKQSQATGVEIGELISFAKGFNTFDDAAQKVGGLNALLGTNIDATKMLMATDDERIKMVQKSIQATGRSFTSLGRFEKQAVMTQLGIKDMSTAIKLLGTEQEKFDQLEKKARKLGLSVSELKERTTAANTVQKNFQAGLQSLGVVVAPIAEFFAKLAKSFAQNAFFSQQIVGTLVILVGLYKTIVLVSRAVAGVSLLIAAAKAKEGFFTALAAGAKVKDAAATGILATAASVGVGPILALGGAIALAGVGLLAFGFGLALAFKGIASVVTSVSGLIGKITELVSVGATGAGSLLTIATAVTLLAGAFALLGTVGLGVGLLSFLGAKSPAERLVSFMKEVTAGVATIEDSQVAKLEKVSKAIASATGAQSGMKVAGAGGGAGGVTESQSGMKVAGAGGGAGGGAIAPVNLKVTFDPARDSVAFKRTIESMIEGYLADKSKTVTPSAKSKLK